MYASVSFLNLLYCAPSLAIFCKSPALGAGAGQANFEPKPSQIFLARAHPCASRRYLSTFFFVDFFFAGVAEEEESSADSRDATDPSLLEDEAADWASAEGEEAAAAAAAEADSDLGVVCWLVVNILR